MKYGFMLFLCFLSKTAICQPTIKLIGTNSSTSCGNFTSLDGNFQSVTFEVTGDWGNSNLDRFNTPQVENQDGTVICLMVIGQGDCTVQTISYYTCTCENKTGGVYHFTVTSSPSTPLAAYEMNMTWTNVPNVVRSDAFSVQEVKDETCPCEVHVVCIALNSTGSVMAFCVLVVLFYFSCKKTQGETTESETTEGKTTEGETTESETTVCEIMIWISLFGVGLCCAVSIGLMICFTVVKNCQTNSETIFTWVMFTLVCGVLTIHIFLLIHTRCHKTKVICNVSFIWCNMVHTENVEKPCEGTGIMSVQTKQEEPLLTAPGTGTKPDGSALSANALATFRNKSQV